MKGSHADTAPGAVNRLVFLPTSILPVNESFFNWIDYRE